MSVHVDHEQCTVVLDGPVTIQTVQSLRMELLTTLGTSEWTADLSGVTELDGVGIQLLVAWKRTVPDLRLHSLPEEARRRCELAGLTPHLFS